MHLPELLGPRGLSDGWNSFTDGFDEGWDEVTGQTTTAKTTVTTAAVVYVTQTPSGYTGNLVTKAASTSSSLSTTPTSTTSSTSSSTSSSSSSSIAPVVSNNIAQASDIIPSTLRPSSQSLAPTLAVATDTAGLATADATKTTSSAARGTVAAASAASSTAVSSSSDGSGGNTAMKAGIAIGVLAGILVVFLAIYFLYTRHKKELEHQIDDDEKVNGPINPFSDAMATRNAHSGADAPRLSLRPVTQFLPNLTHIPQRRQSLNADIMLSPTSAHGHSHGNMATSASAPVMNANKPLPVVAESMWERPGTASAQHPNNPFTNDAAPANPFGNHAERSPLEDQPATRQHVVSMPDEPARPESPARSVSPVSTADSHIAVAVTADEPIASLSPSSRVSGSAGAIAAGLVRKTSIRKDNAPQPLDLTKPMAPGLAPVPSSPAVSEYSMHSVAPGQSPVQPTAGAAAIAAAGGPAQTTVHRVQLDFAPTLEDEMGLKAGQLVRMLHEYDDGWALCIRLDRSEQGVVPRTCLSTRPVKPRPAPGQGPRGGPPVNPNRGPPGRPMTPQGRPMGPPGQYPRPESPNQPMTPGGRVSPPGMGRPDSFGLPMQGRPQSPAGMQQGRPHSPSLTGQGRPHSPSLTEQGRPQSPAGRPQSPAGAQRLMTPPGSSGLGMEYRPGPSGGHGSPTNAPGQAY